MLNRHRANRIPHPSRARSAPSLHALLLGLLSLTSTASAAPPSGLEFTPPPPGSYALPAIQEAADGKVLDVNGQRHRLSEYLGEKLVILSFIYTHCSDVCPLATATLMRVASAVAQTPALAGKVRLITLSFDPERDTPDTLRRYAARFTETGIAEGADWVFLTTASRAELDPILEGYNQYVVRRQAHGNHGEEHQETAFRHVLKVFLIDTDGAVRNIYSVDFLHPQILLNDLRTLLAKTPWPPPSHSAADRKPVRAAGGS